MKINFFFQQILKEFKEFEIENLEIHSGLRISIPQSNNWKLKRFYMLREIEKIADLTDFRSFLYQQKETLEDLTLSTDSSQLISYIITELRNLKKLQISGHNVFPRTFFLHNFFIRSHHKLTVLKITFFNRIVSTREDLLFDVLRHFPALQELSMDFTEFFSPFCDEILRRISLPNLKILGIKNANCEFLKFAKMPKLETLFVDSIQGDDLAIVDTVKKVTAKKVLIELYRIGIYYPNIEFLRIEQSCDITYQKVKYAFENYLKKLKIFEVSRDVIPLYYDPKHWKFNSESSISIFY